MQKEEPLFCVKLEGFGTSSPFVARLFLLILALRDKLFTSNDEKLYFDEIYNRFFEPAKAAYISYQQLMELHNDFIEQFKNGEIQQQLQLLKKMFLSPH